MSVSIDGVGSGTATNTSSFTVSGTLTTTGNPLQDTIVAVIASSSFSPWPQVTSLSDTAGLSWMRRASVSFQTMVGQYQVLEEWYANTTPNLAADSLTITFNQTVDSVAVIWFGLKPSANMVAFDNTESFPLATAGTSSVPTTTFSTDQSPALVIGVYGGITDETSAGAGYTLQGHGTVTGLAYTTSIALQFQSFASNQTNTTCPFGVSSTGWINLVDAFWSNTSQGGGSGSAPNKAVAVQGANMRGGNSGFDTFGMTTY